MELVCLPGTLCDGRVFDPLLAELGYKAPCHDLTGSDTVGAIADHLLPQLPARSILMGFSFGGIVAFELLRRAPERVAGLVLLSTNARADTLEGQAARLRQTALARAAGTEAVIDADWPKHVSPADTGRDDILTLLRAMARAVGPDGFARQSHAAATRPDGRPHLRHWAGPALVVHGTEDRICPPDRGKEIACLLADASLRMIAGAGHFALLEQPDAVAAAIRDWSVAIHKP